MIAAAMLAIGSSISPSFAAAQSGDDPKATVQAFYTTLEDTMKHGAELGFEGRYQKLEPVIQRTFDVPVMAKIAVGAEWTAFSADEKERMLDAFNRYMVTTYAARFKSYKGQQFQVGEVKRVERLLPPPVSTVQPVDSLEQKRTLRRVILRDERLARRRRELPLHLLHGFVYRIVLAQLVEVAVEAPKHAEVLRRDGRSLQGQHPHTPLLYPG